MMKFFVDSASVQKIRAAVESGMCDGVTTNPSLIAKEGRDHEAVIREIAAVMKGPLSVEGIGETAEEMVRDGEKFSSWAPNAVVKVPMTEEGLKAARALEKKGVRTNVTLVFTASQALLAAKAGASYVSPFVGRLDDAGENGMDVVRDIVQIYRNYGFRTEVIVASVRSARHVEEAAKAGAHIATIPAKVLEDMWKHPLTDKGIQLFLEDYRKSSGKK